MKNHKRNIWIYCFYIIALFIFSGNHVEASLFEDNMTGGNKVEEEVETRDDVIVTYYKTIGEQVYYRRWNRTKGFWVDPYWIPA